MKKRSFDILRERLETISRLNDSMAVLYWDESVYMPAGGNRNRGGQLAALTALEHEMFTSKETGRLIDEAMKDTGLSETEKSILSVTAEDYEKAVKIPVAFEKKIAAHGSEIFARWVEAKKKKDFSMVRGLMEKSLEYSREMAGFFPGYDNMLDPLMDFADPGMTYNKTRALFDSILPDLRILLKKITAAGRPRRDFLHRAYDGEKQMSFADMVIRDFGYDFLRGRRDVSEHPMTIPTGIDDVRITTRYQVNDLTDCLFSTFHEAGHAMYEQSIDKSFEYTPLAEGASAGVHESQSRLWENIVGGAGTFWKVYFEDLRKVFPENLGDVSWDEFHHAVNDVHPSLIRTDADEVTYNLHVLIRVELENQLLSGECPLDELPERWNGMYEEYLGVAPPDDAQGVLQDVHWYSGVIGGAFQGYSLGNIMSAQFMDVCVREVPGWEESMRKKDFTPLLGWLRKNIYARGRSMKPEALLKEVTGHGLSARPYIEYLENKYTQWI